MTNKDFNLQLAQSIKSGIAKYQTTIAKNQAKEKDGLAKLNKTIGQQDPALTGAGGNLDSGTASTMVPNVAKGEKKGESNSKRLFGALLAGGRSIDENFAADMKSATEKDKRAKAANTRSEYEAKKIEKGVLPEGGGPGVPGGIGDMNSNADAGFGASEKDMNKDELQDVAAASAKAMNKDEMDGGDDSCLACSGPLEVLGALGNTIHATCRNCGLMHTSTAREENTEAKEDAGPTVAKTEYHNHGGKGWGSAFRLKQPGEGYVEVRNNPANKSPFASSAYKSTKDANKAARNNKRAEYEASKVEKAEPLATMRTKKMKGISGLPAPSSKMVVKAELAKVTPPGEEKLVHKLKNEYGHDKAGKSKAYATAWAIHNKTVNKTELTSNKTSPQVGTVAAENVKGAKDGSEKVPEAKKTDSSGDISKGKIEKGAMVDHVKAAAAKAGVPVKAVLGYQAPKTLASVKPMATPNFNRSAIPNTGVARELAIKTGKPVIPGRPMVTKLTGGAQGQIAAQKRPLIPMVNRGVVAKAEPTMAKPVTKSPGSAPAAKVSAPKPASTMNKPAPKL